MPEPIRGHDPLGIAAIADVPITTRHSGVHPVSSLDLIGTDRPTAVSDGRGRVRMATRLDLSNRIEQRSKVVRGVG
jgi:hypothetical protein